MKCPKCNEEMEHGFLNAGRNPESLAYGAINATWDLEKNAFSSSEDFIALPEEDCGSFVIEGERCLSCRVLLLSY